MTVTCNDPQHEAKRRFQRVQAEVRAQKARHAVPSIRQAVAVVDAIYGTPCLVCGAPINNRGEGHDPGCMGFDS